MVSTAVDALLIGSTTKVRDEHAQAANSFLVLFGVLLSALSSRGESCSNAYYLSAARTDVEQRGSMHEATLLLMDCCQSTRLEW